MLGEKDRNLDDIRTGGAADGSWERHINQSVL